MGLVVDDAERSQLETTGFANGDACVEAKVGVASYERVSAKSRVLGGILDNKGFVLPDGMVTECHRARCFLCIHSVVGFKPLPLLVQDREQCGFHTVELPGDSYQAIKTLLRRRIQNP